MGKSAMNGGRKVWGEKRQEKRKKKGIGKIRKKKEENARDGFHHG